MVSSRSASNRIGAFCLHASHDTLKVSAPGRAAAAANLDARLLAEIDARDPGLPQEERQRRLKYAKKAHYARLALKAARARRERAELVAKGRREQGLPARIEDPAALRQIAGLVGNGGGGGDA